MMCSSSRAAGTVTTTSTVMQQLVRLLLLALVLVALCRPSVEARATVSVAEDEDSSFADGSSDEELLPTDGSFEQDVSANNGRAAADELSERSEEEATTNTTTSGASEEPGHEHQAQDVDEEQPTGTTVGYNAVATTPKIVPVVKQLSRYEQGLEDYDEAADRAEREQQQQLQRQEQEQEQSLQQQYSGMVKPMLTLFNVISTVLSSGRSMRAMAGTDGGNKNVTSSTFAAKSTSEDAPTNNDHANATDAYGAHNENETATAVTGGRYIKGDPLNGYYDFVISEGSYKFWVVMQLFTAGLVLYATFAAIYYSKVSPLTSDYDYIDYLNGARSFAGGRSMITGTGGAMGSPGGGGSIWEKVASNRWFGPAAQTFEMVMSAIENAPK